MQPVEVTVRFDREGMVTPLHFTWKDSQYLVESTGRRWEASDGKHMLVMVPGGRIFELVFTPSQGRWFLRTAKPDRMAV
jgi:hypothetical protein